MKYYYVKLTCIICCLIFSSLLTNASTDEEENNYYFIFNENVTRDQAENLFTSHSMEYLYSSTLWESKTMKLYISEESQYMYSETLRNEEIVNYVGQEVAEDEEEPDESGEIHGHSPLPRCVLSRALAQDQQTESGQGGHPAPAPWLKSQAMHPLQTEALHPARCPTGLAGDEVERSANSHADGNLQSR